MKTLAVMCVALISALGVSAALEPPTISAGDTKSAEASLESAATTGASPSAGASITSLPTQSASFAYACDGSVRDHRARRCQVRFPPLCDNHLPASQVATCAVAGSKPPGCFCTCDVLCNPQTGRRETKPGTIILGN